MIKFPVAKLPLAAAVGLAVMVGVFPGTATATAAALPAHSPCIAFAGLAGQPRDAGPALQACLDATPPGGSIAVPAGRYLLASPVIVRHPVTLTTRGSPSTAPACSRDEARCAAFRLAIVSPVPAGTIMPFRIASNNVRLDRLIFEGTRRTDPISSARRCAAEAERPLGGGLRIDGDDVVIRRSVFRDMACYTALEYGAGNRVTITDNDFVGNGTHNAALGWADGLTIHNARRFVVTGNRFRDNTDVQLIFGSCIGCTIAGNSFRHGAAAGGGSFAELMLQAWPNATSGDFTDTRVFDNDIDCGATRRCGFGIMIGSTPWYDAPAFGGLVTGNRVRRAILALDVDRLSGPMTIERNRLMPTSGLYPAVCGPQRIDGVAANISPGSRQFVKSTHWPHATTYRSYCILNYAIADKAVP